MKKCILIIITATTLLAACATKKNIAASNHQDGLTYQTAVVIKETSERPGIDAEYAWLKSNYSGYKSRGQALVYKEKKPYDLIHITTVEGKDIDIYFDISNFFGKF